MNAQSRKPEREVETAASQELGGQEPVRPGNEDVGRDEVVDAVVGASRALVAVAARSLANVGEEVTLPQYRALVVLAARGSQRLADLAETLEVNPSTTTRMCDRLVAKQLVRRRRGTGDRRAVRVSLTPAGRELIAEVTRRRRAEIGEILDRLPAEGRRGLVSVLRAFADAAGEVPEQDWSLGWEVEADETLRAMRNPP